MEGGLTTEVSELGRSRMNLRIIVVEDDERKAAVVSEVILHHCEHASENIHVFKSVIDAKKALAQNQYDLCILDLNLPFRSGETSKKNAGCDLLDEIHEMDHLYKVPHQVVGLTSYSDEYQASKPHFTNYLFCLLQYDEAKNDWRDKLKHLLKRVSNSLRNDTQHDANDTVCVVTALAALELEAMLKLSWDWQELCINGDSSFYYRTKTIGREGKEWEIVIAAADNVGMPSTIPLAMKMIQEFRPKYISMTGISAGKKGEVSIGDVIVADPCWDWGSGKYAVEDGQRTFKPDPRQIPLSSELRQKFQKMKMDTKLVKAVLADWDGNVPAGRLNMHIGPHASGAAVLADSDLFDQIEKHNRKIIGIEMEAYGIFTAATLCSEPRPMPFVLKSVSDYADELKGDDYQAYAAYTSASFFKYFVERYL